MEDGLDTGSIARVQCSVGDKTVFTVCGPLACASRSVQVENSLLLKDVMTQPAFCPGAPTFDHCQAS